jgi:hypothetical protein
MLRVARVRPESGNDRTMTLKLFLLVLVIGIIVIGSHVPRGARQPGPDTK